MEKLIHREIGSDITLGLGTKAVAVSIERGNKTLKMYLESKCSCTWAGNKGKNSELLLNMIWCVAVQYHKAQSKERISKEIIFKTV